MSVGWSGNPVIKRGARGKSREKLRTRPLFPPPTPSPQLPRQPAGTCRRHSTARHRTAPHTRRRARYRAVPGRAGPGGQRGVRAGRPPIPGEQPRGSPGARCPVRGARCGSGSGCRAPRGRCQQREAAGCAEGMLSPGGMQPARWHGSGTEGMEVAVSPGGARAARPEPPLAPPGTCGALHLQTPPPAPRRRGRKFRAALTPCCPAAGGDTGSAPTGSPPPLRLSPPGSGLPRPAGPGLETCGGEESCGRGAGEGRGAACPPPGGTEPLVSLPPCRLPSAESRPLCMRGVKLGGTPKPSPWILS